MKRRVLQKDSGETSMDTDDLFNMAWGIIPWAAQVSDTLKADLGARCSKYGYKDDWLNGVLKFLLRIAEDLSDYVDYEKWSSLPLTHFGT